jgi:MFS family permease
MSGRAAILARLPAPVRRRDFAILVGIVGSMGLAAQMVDVAIGWQVYDIHHRAFDLGLIGLVEFAPVFLLALPAGQLVDRVSRRLLLAVSITLLVAIAAVLVALSSAGVRELWPFLVLAAAAGVSTALSFPVTRALPAMLVERDLLAHALAVRSVANQVTSVGGPALGGLLFAVSPELVYVVALVLFATALAGSGLLRVPQRELAPAGQPLDLDALFGGIRFIRDTPILLGAILLDLFAVLFGGAVALLPAFAQSVLHTGPVGLGILRSAPAVGAVVTGFALVRRPVLTRTGPTLLVAVGLFGVSIVVFGLSHWMLLSLAALAVSGAADMISVNIRTTTASLVTPDDLRGRVGSVEAVFIGASNQLGAFESGAAAALVGAVTSVVIGGGLTILIALAWIPLFPALARLGDARDVRPPAEVVP